MKVACSLLVVLLLGACSSEPQSEASADAAKDTVIFDVPQVISADHSGLLKVGVPANPPLAGKVDASLLPANAVDWLAVVEYEKGSGITMAQVLTTFNAAWQDQNGWPVLFAYDTRTGYWTNPEAMQAAQVTKLCFNWKLVQGRDNIRIVFSEKNLQRFLDGVRFHAERLGPASVTPQTSVEEGATRARQLGQLVGQCERFALLRLAADDQAMYPRDTVWDALLALGLTWNEQDGLFRLENRQFNWGERDFFTIGTTTEPGFFDPREGHTQGGGMTDLILGFSIPRSAHPEGVGHALFRAAGHLQERLGGTITNIDGEPLDTNALGAEIATISQALREAGFPAGKMGTT
ncbi:MAG: cell division protein ZipA C-terminal FtsZ-binding domain-containing protein, partial [Bacteroidota bacterium]